MAFFDTHCHLDLLQGFISAEKALINAELAEVTDIFIPGVCGFPELISSENNKQDDEKNAMTRANLYYGWGYLPQHYSKYCSISNTSQISAVGECGLDKRISLELPKQLDLFERHLQLANDAVLPCVVHLVGYYELALKLLKRYKLKRGFVIHSFSGAPEIAEAFVKLGGKISLSPHSLRNVTKLYKLFNTIPMSAILLETDAPDCFLRGLNKSYGEPADLILVAKQVAEIAGVKLSELALYSYQTSKRLFNS